MKKVTVLFSLFAVLLLAGATLIQQNDTEKKAIMAVLEEESAAWYSSDFDRWADTYVHNQDYMGISVSRNGYGITNGWQALSENTTVNTKRQLINQEKVPVKMKVYGDIAWVVFNNFNVNEKGEKTLTWVVTAILEKDAGKWRMTYRSAINVPSYLVADTYLLLMINYGKSLGKTVEEIGVSVGNTLKPGWNQSMGVQGFINGIISNWRNVCMPENFKILERDESHSVFTLDKIYPNLKAAGKMYGVTYDEYIGFLKVLSETLADHMGAIYKQEMTPEGIKVSISKK